MQHHAIKQPDFGTGKKKLGIYLVGLISCVVLTLLAFGVVRYKPFPTWQVFLIIYSAACVQFLVQVVCFLRLNAETEQGKNNILSFLFTGVILISIIMGSLWIMWNVNYYMAIFPVITK